MQNDTVCACQVSMSGNVIEGFLGFLIGYKTRAMLLTNRRSD